MAITSKPITHGKEREYRGLSTDTKPTVNVGLNSLFFELDTGKFYYWSGKAPWAEIGTAPALTDLTGTTWQIAEEVASLPNPTLAASLNFTSNSANWDTLILDGEDGDIAYMSADEPTPAYRAGSWTNNNYRTVAITGGSDATNADLIAWFEANATRVA